MQSQRIGIGARSARNAVQCARFRRCNRCSIECVLHESECVECGAIRVRRPLRRARAAIITPRGAVFLRMRAPGRLRIHQPVRRRRASELHLSSRTRLVAHQWCAARRRWLPFRKGSSRNRKSPRVGGLDWTGLDSTGPDCTSRGEAQRGESSAPNATRVGRRSGASWTLCSCG